MDVTEPMHVSSCTFSANCAIAKVSRKKMWNSHSGNEYVKAKRMRWMIIWMMPESGSKLSAVLTQLQGELLLLLWRHHSHCLHCSAACWTRRAFPGRVAAWGGRWAGRIFFVDLLAHRCWQVMWEMSSSNNNQWKLVAWWLPKFDATIYCHKLCSCEWLSIAM